ncbi:MAG: hypothetical protein JSS72_03515 [Armatimonadetes bacterium]|nr:hypothetical protein [Armatimonadota bacterium]
MKKTLILAIIATAAISGADSFKKEIAKHDSHIKAFFLKRDADGFGKYIRPFVTSDFVHSEHGQTMNFDQMMGEMKMGLGMYKKIDTVSMKYMSTSSKGNEGWATCWHKMGGTMVGADKKTHRMEFIGTTKNTYRKENGEWKLAKMEWTEDKMMLDGKPFDPSAQGHGK